MSIKKLFLDNQIGVLFALFVLAYVVYTFGGYFSSKGSSGFESNSEMSQQYKNTNAQMSASVQPSEPLGQNEVFASANGTETSMPGLPSSCSQPSIQNPSDLLPKDSNNKWAQLNPSGKGDLANVNLLKAGYHIGIDTIGQSLRNANLQIRSEPPNPQLYTGPWQMSTISPDTFRPSLEIGSGPP